MRLFNLTYKSTKAFFLLLIACSMMFGCLYAQNNSNYITLNVIKNSLIKIKLSAEEKNTPIQIVSGNNNYNIPVSSNEYKLDCLANSDTITIYGNISKLDCSNNHTKIIGIDATNSTTLKQLDCSDDSITSLNISDCKSLEWLDCHNTMITSLKIENCLSLKCIDCCINNLNSLSINNCKTLKYVFYNICSTKYMNINNCSSSLEIIGNTENDNIIEKIKKESYKFLNKRF